MAVSNDRPFIERAVDSILDQTLGNWELLISDDCSTDGSRELLTSIRNDPRIRITLQPKKLGLVANKNFLRRRARGRFVTQQDADDTCRRDRLELQTAAFDRSPDVGIVGCGLIRIDVHDVEIGRTVPSFDFRLAPGQRSQFAFWFAPMMVRRELISTIGDFDPYFDGSLGEDWYWGIRAAEKTAVYCIADALYSYRVVPGSVTNVLDDRRKLTMSRVIEILITQRQETGTDLLEKRDVTGLAKLESSVALDRYYMAEQLRIWAAKAIDAGEFSTARRFLRSSVRRHFKLGTLRTVFYYLRARFR